MHTVCDQQKKGGSVRSPVFLSKVPAFDGQPLDEPRSANQSLN